MLSPKNLKPTSTRVLIEKPKPQVKTTASGIVLDLGQKLVEKNRSQSLEDKEIEDEHNMYEGIVIAVGPDVKGIKAKDKVYLNKYAGFEVEKDSRIYLVDQKDILATT